MSFLETLHEMKRKRHRPGLRSLAAAPGARARQNRLRRLGTCEQPNTPRHSRGSPARSSGRYVQAGVKIMVELGWAPVRVRDFARGGYLEQVRGYCRQPIHYS